VPTRHAAAVAELDAAHPDGALSALRDPDCSVEPRTRLAPAAAAHAGLAAPLIYNDVVLSRVPRAGRPCWAARRWRAALAPRQPRRSGATPLGSTSPAFAAGWLPVAQRAGTLSRPTPLTPITRRRDDSPILRPTALTGPGWVRATVARRTYRRRLGFVEYDPALAAEGSVLVLDSGWRFIGLRRLPPLVAVVDEGWLRRPAELHRRRDATSLWHARSAVA